MNCLIVKIDITHGNNKLHLSFQHGLPLQDEVIKDEGFAEGHGLIAPMGQDNGEKPSVVNQTQTRTPMSVEPFQFLNFSLRKQPMLPSLTPGLFARLQQEQSGTVKHRQTGTGTSALSPQTKAVPRVPAPRNRRGIFECNYCGKVFPTWTGRYYHMPIHTGKWKHSCLICDKHFMRTDRYDQHIEKHRVEHKAAGNLHN